MPDDATSLLQTRRSLLSRLKRCDDQSAWQTFFDTYGRLLYRVARKAGLTDAEVQDAVQETVIKVSKHLGPFRYEPAKCSFKTWLMLLAKQRIATQFAKRNKAGQAGWVRAGNHAPAGRSEDPPRTGTVEQIPDPARPALEAVWHEEWKTHVLATLTERVKQQVKPEQWQMFHLYALQQWPPRDVARVLRVRIAQVYLAKHRIGRLLKKEARRMERELGRAEQTGQ